MYLSESWEKDDGGFTGTKHIIILLLKKKSHITLIAILYFFNLICMSKEYA